MSHKIIVKTTGHLHLINSATVAGGGRGVGRKKEQKKDKSDKKSVFPLFNTRIKKK